LPLLKGVKILIAEDNAINMMVTCEFLKRWEMTIITAEDGKAAQQKLLEHQDIDVALLDLQMPGMDGYELMAWIKEEHIEIPVIAFTAQIITNEGRLELQQTGFVDIMPKPFDPKTLGEKIRNALVADKVFS
jgi:CheY-like chemotaxis protein